MLRRVEAEIITRDAALLEITLRHPSGRHETILTTDEHPFWVKGQGWVRADSLQPGREVDGLEGGSEVVGVAFTSNRTTVYNLTIDGNPNDFVGPDGVWVHNVDPLDCFGGFRRVWKRHAPEKANELRMKAKNTPGGPPQGVFNSDPKEVATLLSSRLEPGKHFDGMIAAPAGMARVFMPGSGAEAPASMIRVIWDGKRLQHLYPAW